jgi:HK97 gp10 family phage protein
VPLKGARAHLARLKVLAGPAMTRAVGKALFAGGELIQTEAQVSISRGAISGKGHVPSAPGEPPNYDTGVLANNIETTQPGPLRVQVASNAPYSAPLEFGTSRMAARPFMRPARDAKRREVRALVQQAMNHVVKRSRRSD